ncbi:MAG: glycosyltransferase family 2 protein [Porphyromonadaceae bacterium]|nr:glycosyltransferase family 2 protein [Porphyromonadaceae bacterium]
MRLAIVVPCYNEEDVLTDSARQLNEMLCHLAEKGKISENSFILFVNDGSKDKTWELIEKLYRGDKHIFGLNLASNRGHQNALLAGLMTVKDICDAAVSIDVDLQDDVACIEDMVDTFAQGFDIVYGIRSSRKNDTFFKRSTALTFYRLMTWLGAHSIYNHADYRLMSRRALQSLSEYPERNLFLRGIIPTIGYKTATIPYERKERLTGKSKYPLRKMVNFAIEGITSFSIKPIRLISSMGFLILFITLIVAIYTMISFFLGYAVEGWTSLMLSFWFLGSVLLIAIGIIGEYIGKIYLEVKQRPRYNIETFLSHDHE